MAQIHSITYQPVDQQYQGRFDHFIRQPVNEAKLIAGHGIEGDAKAGHNPNRQINLLSQEWVEGKSTQGYSASPGSFGEQMILTGVDFSRLTPNTHLQLGESAVIEITKARTGCERLDLSQPKPMDEKYVGLLARVIESGTVRIGDAVKILENA